MKEGAGFLANTGSMAASSVLGTCKATGKAVALCQDGVRGACKGVAFIATRSSDLLGSSVRFLNPLKKRVAPAKPAKPPHEPEQKLRMPHQAHPAEKTGPVVSTPSGRATPGGDLRTADAGALSGRGGAAARVGPVQAEVDLLARGRAAARASTPLALPQKESVVLEGRGKTPVAATGTKEEASRELAVTQPERGTAPPDVTPEEVQAATFAGAAERVVFRRALSDMKRQVEATRLEAAKTMGGIRHELSARALAACFSRESSARVREECVNALTRLGMQEGLPTVEGALADPVALVRLAAVRGTYRLAGPGCAAALIPMLCDGSEDVRRRAATCIGWLGEKSYARELVQLLADTSASVRSAVLDALGNLGSQRVVPEIIGLLNDPTESVRRKASDVLRAITGERKTLTVPGDEGSRRRLIARWRAWWEQAPRVQGSD